MEIETPRLRLRRWRQEDREPFFRINDEPNVHRYLLRLTRDGSDRMLERIDQHFAAHGWGFWAVEERAGGTLIGLCGLARIPWQEFFTPAVEIGWRLSSEWQGKGLAREAAEAVLAYAWNRAGLDRVVAFTVADNTASWGLMERLGMQRIGAFDHPRLDDGHPLRRHIVYEIKAPRR
jgi:RimJ/RimL family protein N-acetyltransferase